MEWLGHGWTRLASLFRSKQSRWRLRQSLVSAAVADTKLVHYLCTSMDMQIVWSRTHAAEPLERVPVPTDLLAMLEKLLICYN
jgi:hypothetical protein